MIDNYAFHERIAIKMDSGMLQLDAIREAKAEFEARQIAKADHIAGVGKAIPECVSRLESHRLRVANDKQTK